MLLRWQNQWIGFPLVSEQRKWLVGAGNSLPEQRTGILGTVSDGISHNLSGSPTLSVHSQHLNQFSLTMLTNSSNSSTSSALERPRVFRLMWAIVPLTPPTIAAQSFDIHRIHVECRANSSVLDTLSALSLWFLSYIFRVVGSLGKHPNLCNDTSHSRIYSVHCV